MAKEINQLTKGTASFNIVGKALINSYTFTLDKESQKSDWVYNQMQLKVHVGEYGDIKSEMMGGYGSERDNVVYVHGRKDDNKDDFKNSFTIAWEDRFDEEVLKTIGDMCFITVGLEKDENEKVIYKKFLTQYDAITYIKEHLKDGEVINVKGNLSYQIYNGNLSVKKEITSIALSSVEEKDFKATFTQTLLVESDGVGKPNKETRTLPITAYVVDFANEFDGKNIIRMVNGKKKKGTNIPMVKEFDFKIGEDIEKAKKMVKYFKAKNKKVTEITVEGIFKQGGNLETQQVTLDDIPDDIKELIELGLYDEKEILDKQAFANGANKTPEEMLIIRPRVNMVGDEGNKTPQMAVDPDKYNEEDLYIDNVLEVNGAKFDISEDEVEDITEETEVEEDDIFSDDDWDF